MRRNQLRKILINSYLLVFLISCNINPQNSALPITTLNAKDFIVKSGYYPADWQALACESIICRSNDGSTYEQFFNPIEYEAGQFFQEVYRLSTIKAAKEKFLIYQKGEYNRESLDPNGTNFVTPPELSYKSTVADQYYFACAHQFGYVCKMIARYKNYFMFMYFDMNDGQGYGLTYEEVEKILISVDEQAIRLLYP